VLMIWSFSAQVWSFSAQVLVIQRTSKDTRY
jgi:hypothetical protein